MNIYVDTAFGLYNLLSDSGGVMIGLKSIKMTGQHYICNYWQSLLTMDLLLNSNCPISMVYLYWVSRTYKAHALDKLRKGKNTRLTSSASNQGVDEGGDPLLLHQVRRVVRFQARGEQLLQKLRPPVVIGYDGVLLRITVLRTWPDILAWVCYWWDQRRLVMSLM